MKKGKAALFDPYLDVLGGGEKHILSILKVLDNMGYDIDIFWDENLPKNIKSRFHLDFTSLTFKPSVFKKNVSALTRTITLFPYDFFFYVTDGSYFLSSARKNFIFCMVPNKDLYSKSYINKLKTVNATFISNSGFTASHLKKWGIKSKVLYPYVSTDFFSKNNGAKEKVILSVGRFFGGLHVKNHKTMISNFKKLSKNGLLKGYKLILAGGLKKEDQTYFNSLKTIIKDSSDIALEPNISFEKLLKLYQKANVYWHFTGYGVDEDREPEKTEHLGITPLEAMASSCIVFCYKAGGIKELIKNNDNGFTFTTEKELSEKMGTVLKDEKLQQRIRVKARGFVIEHFGQESFEKKVKEVLFDKK